MTRFRSLSSFMRFYFKITKITTTGKCRKRGRITDRRIARVKTLLSILQSALTYSSNLERVHRYRLTVAFLIRYSACREREREKKSARPCAVISPAIAKYFILIFFPYARYIMLMGQLRAIYEKKRRGDYGSGKTFSTINTVR